jgi:hypothetical protein
VTAKGGHHGDLVTKGYRLEPGEKLRGLEPVAAISHPPTQDSNRNSGEQSPQNGQGKIGNQAQGDESSPEDLALHPFILARELDLWTTVRA